MTALIAGLARRLISEKLLDHQQAITASANAHKIGTSLAKYLIHEKLLDQRSLALIVADEYGLPILELDAFDPHSCPEKLIDIELIERHQVLPLAVRSSRLTVALSDPGDQIVLDELGFHTGLTVETVVVEQGKLLTAIEDYIQRQGRGYTAIDSASDLGMDNIEIDSNRNQETEEELDSSDETPLVRFINKLLIEAIKVHASDIHFEPYESLYRVRFRIDGVLHEITQPPVKLSTRLASRIKIMAQLDISVKRLPQDGRIRIRLEGNKLIDLRVNILPTLWGEKIVLRILDPMSNKIDIDTLGMETIQKECFSRALRASQGLILITGPTGSGKTSSLYSGLKQLNTTEKNICTVEDPVEINIEGINQLAVNSKAGLTFSCALRSILRQDPDIIMLGEVRDLETAEIVVRAAQTGHLVLTTLHTVSAAASLSRLRSIGIAPYNLAGTVSLIIAQRLARRLCNNCKESIELHEKVLIEQGFDPLQLDTLKLHKAVGCDYCKDGYSGRVGFYEVVPISDCLSRIIMKDGPTSRISEHIKKSGLLSLREAVLLKVAQGLTTLEEANRLT